MVEAATLAERVLVHLREHPTDPEAPDVPRDVTQDGIAEALGARAAHVSRALQGLLSRGLVSARLARARGGKRRCRAHSLTPEGLARAKEFTMPALAPAATVGARPIAARSLRARELEALARVLDEAARGGPRVALVEGDAGTGKTRFLEAFATVAAARGARVLSGRGAPAGGEQWLGPLRDALAPAGLDARARALHAGTERERALAASVETLAAAARSSTVALLLDDVHLAGPDAVRFLHGVMLGLPKSARILIVAAFRREEAWELPNGPLYTALMPLRQPPVGALVALGPLAPEQLSQLLQEAGHRLPPELQARVAQESGGIPLYALAMAEALADGEDEGDFSPAVVAETVKERVATVGPDALAVLQAAAVCGAEFEVGLLSRVQGGAEEVLVASLDVLLDRLLLEEHGGGASLRFEHPKVREVVLSDMTAQRRRHLSERLARASLGE